MDEYPRYVFKGPLMALVHSLEERELLPDWQDRPGGNFQCPVQAHFHGADAVLGTDVEALQRLQEELSDDEENDEDEEGKAAEETAVEEVEAAREEDKEVEDNSPIYAPEGKKAPLTDIERIKARAAITTARNAKAKAKREARLLAAKSIEAS